MISVRRRTWMALLGLLTSLAAAYVTRSAMAETRWPAEQSAGPFHCHADFPLQQFDRLWHEMALLQQDLTRQLKVPAAEEPVHLFLFERKGTYQDYLRRHFPGVPYRRALFIKERGPGMVFAHLNSDFETDVRHESTHALLHATLPVVPLWLDEGLAEYFEVPAQSRAYKHEHLSKVAWAARLGQVPSLEELEQVGSLNDMGSAEYRYAWAWVHFMLHGPAEAHAELVAFLDDLRMHSPPGQLSARLRRRFPDLERRYRDHFRSWKE